MVFFIAWRVVAEESGAAHYMPWCCADGSVTLAWHAQLQAGFNYYWNDIPIPAEMVRKGKLCGRVSLTAILRPLVSPLAGANYFSSRLQTSVEYTRDGEWQSLAGSMLESTLEEQSARDELKKWQPVVTTVTSPIAAG